MTTLLTWKHVRVGIPRTVRSVAQAWQRLGYTNVRLCRVVPEIAGYVEVGPEQIVESSGPAGRVEKLVAAVQKKLKARARMWAKTGLRRVLGHLPISLHEPVRDLAWCCKETALCLCRLLARAWASNLRGRFSRANRVKAAITGDDLVVLLGGDWEVDHASEIVWKLKKEVGFRLVSMIHDVIPFVAPQYVVPHHAAKVTRWQTDTLWSSDLVLVNSRYTQMDLEKFCRLTGAPCPPIEVFRLGDCGEESEVHGDAEPVPTLAGGEPFVLSVGTLEIRKNHLLLYHVWGRLAEELGAKLPRLVFAGSPGWLANDMVHMVRTDPRTRDKVLFLSGLTDRQMVWLYRHCLFTMYPSFYEGWGLPVSESLNQGKYCIAASSSSIPEIGGDLVGMHDPRDWSACLQLARQALLDPAFLTRRESEIRARYRPTPWRASALQVAARIEKHFGPVFERKETAEHGDTGASAGALPDRPARSRRSA